MGSKSIYLTPFKGRLTAFNLFESLKVGNFALDFAATKLVTVLIFATF